MDVFLPNKHRYRGNMGPKNIGTICLHIFTGLRYLHDEKNLLHRDLKPDNVLINTTPVTAVIGGLGSCAREGESYDHGVGTRLYFPPERLALCHITTNDAKEKRDAAKEIAYGRLAEIFAASWICADLLTKDGLLSLLYDSEKCIGATEAAINQVAARLKANQKEFSGAFRDLFTWVIQGLSQKPVQRPNAARMVERVENMMGQL